MSTVTLAYSCLARNRSAADLSAALQALPLDANSTALMGLTLASDTPTTSGNLVTRTVVYTTGAPPQLIPDANIGETLVDWYGVTFTKALSTPVTAAAPVVT